MSVAGSAARAASSGSKKSVEDTPVILEVAISGTNSKKNNPLVPESVKEHIAEIDRCLDAVLLDTGVVPLAGYDDSGVGSDDSFFWYAV